MVERDGHRRGTWLATALVLTLGSAALPAQQPTMAVRGVVVDVRGFGVPAAEVWVGEDSDLRGDVVLARTFADGEGVFLLPRVPIDDALLLHVRAEGMVATRQRVSPTRPDHRLTVRETLPVRGTLRDSRGNPVRGALVWTPTQDPRCEATTDDDGAFVLTAVGLGPTVLHSWVPGEGGVGQRVLVGTGADVEMVAQPGPCEPVRVLVSGYPDTAPEPVELHIDNAMGAIDAIGPLPAGRRPTTRWQWGNDFLRGAMLQVRPNAPGFVFVEQPKTDVDRRTRRTHFRAYPIGQAPTTRYEFVVRSEHGHPVQRAQFELSREHHRDPVCATSDDRGVIRFDSTLSPGDKAELRSADPRWVVESAADAHDHVPTVTLATSMRACTLTTEQPTPFSVKTSSTVTGRVLRADRQPARCEQVSLYYLTDDESRPRWRLYVAWTDQKGEFAFGNLPPLRPELIVCCGDATSAAFSLSGSGTNIRLDDLQLRVPTSVEGVVRDADGKLAAGVPLVVVSGEEKREAITDRQGRYRVPDIAPGLVQLTAPDWPDGPSTLSKPVLVAAGSTATIDGQR